MNTVTRRLPEEASAMWRRVLIAALSLAVLLTCGIAWLSRCL